MYLFDAGKSHPQIVSILKDIEPDESLVTLMVDKAMKDEWDILYNEAKQLFSEGVPKDQVLAIISEKEPDLEIVEWICGEWYELKLFFMECLHGGPANAFEGMFWMIITAAVLAIMFYVQASWLLRSLWIAVFIVATIQWWLGREQRNMAKRIERLFNSDIKGPED
jgi:hypothetical protein